MSFQKVVYGASFFIYTIPSLDNNDFKYLHNEQILITFTSLKINL